MRGYYIWTIGCQMNKADSEMVGSALQELGFKPAHRAEHADVVVINSCTVRQAAEDKVLGKLGALKKLKLARPDTLVCLTGCMVPPDHFDLQRRLPHVDLFFGPQKFNVLLDELDRRGFGRPEDFEARLQAAPPITRQAGDGEWLDGVDIVDPAEFTDDPVFESGVTRWSTIIHGCNHNCTYCIIPFRRGREVSRPIETIAAEIERYVASGAREVTLLGQIVDSYGHDLPGKPDLSHLLRRLGEIDGLWRTRFLTSHPMHLRDSIIDAVAELPNVCEHINIPSQAGDDAVLRRMRRGYTIEKYERLVDRIRERVPGVSLSTDIIVGFPGETDAQFENTCAHLERVRFDVVHVAMFSPRPGTKAAEWADDVPKAEKLARLHRVEEIQQRIATEINARLAGATVEVLVESRDDDKWRGRTRNDKIVFFLADGDWTGRLAQVRIERTSPWSLQGVVVGESDLSLNAARRGPRVIPLRVA